MAEIVLSNGMVATVDDDDLPLVSGLKWHAQEARGTWYAYSMDQRRGLKRKTYMHRMVAGSLPGEKTDHRDGNGLNNRRLNLRRCTNAQNMFNVKSGRGRSQFKGVAWFRRDERWRAYLAKDYRQIHLGYFDSEIDAARAYDAAAIQHFGEFARLNFPAPERSIA